MKLNDASSVQSDGRTQNCAKEGRLSRAAHRDGEIKMSGFCVPDKMPGEACAYSCAESDAAIVCHPCNRSESCVPVTSPTGAAEPGNCSQQCRSPRDISRASAAINRDDEDLHVCSNSVIGCCCQGKAARGMKHHSDKDSRESVTGCDRTDMDLKNSPNSNNIQACCSAACGCCPGRNDLTNRDPLMCRDVCCQRWKSVATIDPLTSWMNDGTSASPRRASGPGLEDHKSKDLHKCRPCPGLGCLPHDVLFVLADYLPTVSVLACAAVSPAFSALLRDQIFLDRHTRRVLGLGQADKDVRYQDVPGSVSPLQDLWYMTYLQRAAPEVAGLVVPGVVFYDLLSFRHLLDSWLMQGLGHTLELFLRDAVTMITRPRPHLLKQNPPFALPRPLLTRLALCQPQLLMTTISNFHTLAVTPWQPASLASVWDRVRRDNPIASGQDASPTGENVAWPSEVVEVVTRYRVGSSLAACLISLSPRAMVCWTGLVKPFTFSLETTWGLCTFLPSTPLAEVRQKSREVFGTLVHVLSGGGVSLHCPEAFMFPGLCAMVQNHRPPLVYRLQMILKTLGLRIKDVVREHIPPESLLELKVFVDSVTVMGTENPGHCRDRRKRGRATSPTLGVAFQRYLHRYLNLFLGAEVLRLYRHPSCHRALCPSCHNSSSIPSRPPSACLLRVSRQRLPLKMWPPHVLRHAVTAMSALARIVIVDVDMWNKDTLSLPLTPMVHNCITAELDYACLPFSLDPSKPGVIARRLQESE